MKINKSDLQEMKKLLRSFGFCNEVEKMIKKHGVNVWEKCTAYQICDFIDGFMNELAGYAPISSGYAPISYKSFPVTKELVNYYWRASASMALVLLEMLVETINFKTKKWYDLVQAVTNFADSGSSEDGVFVRSKIAEFGKQAKYFFYSDTLYFLLRELRCITYRNGACCDSLSSSLSEEATKIVNIIALFGTEGSNLEQRLDKAEKIVADRIRTVVDPPSLEELRAVKLEKEKIG